MMCPRFTGPDLITGKRDGYFLVKYHSRPEWSELLVGLTEWGWISGHMKQKSWLSIVLGVIVYSSTGIPVTKADCSDKSGHVLSTELTLFTRQEFSG